MRKAIFAAVGIFASLLSAQAIAGDRPAVALSATSYDWSGFYVGGNVGVGWGHSNFSFADPGNAGFFGCGPAQVRGIRKIRGRVTPLGLAAFTWVTIGRRHTISLAGVEGDFTWSGIRISSNTPLTQIFGTFPNSNVNFQTDAKWAFIRSRAPWYCAR